ncbi:MAG: hypothetical protein V8T17_06860 [Oscillospiraceae bacterium]
MGDPEETGRALREQYRHFWLVIVQRIAIFVTIVACVQGFFMLPMLSGVYESIRERVSPAVNSISWEELDGAADLHERILVGDDIVQLNRIEYGVREGERQAVLWVSSYDRIPGRKVYERLIETMSLQSERGETMYDYGTGRHPGWYSSCWEQQRQFVCAQRPAHRAARRGRYLRDVRLRPLRRAHRDEDRASGRGNAAMKKQKIEKRPTRARRAVKSVVIMLCALLICNMLGGGHLTRAMALRDGEQRYGVYEKTHEITSLPAENIYKTLRVTLMASENVTYCGASHFYTLLGWQDDFGVPLDCSDGESIHAGWWDMARNGVVRDIFYWGRVDDAAVDSAVIAAIPRGFTR